MRVPRGVLKKHDRVINRKTLDENGQPLQLTVAEIPEFLRKKALADKVKAEEQAAAANAYVEGLQSELVDKTNELETCRAELEAMKKKMGMSSLNLDALPPTIGEPTKPTTTQQQSGSSSQGGSHSHGKPRNTTTNPPPTS